MYQPSYVTRCLHLRILFSAKNELSENISIPTNTRRTHIHAINIKYVPVCSIDFALGWLSFRFINLLINDRNGQERCSDILAWEDIRTDMHIGRDEKARIATTTSNETAIYAHLLERANSIINRGILQIYNALFNGKYIPRKEQIFPAMFTYRNPTRWWRKPRRAVTGKFDPIYIHMYIANLNCRIRIYQIKSGV